MNSPPWSPTSCIVPYCGTFGVLFSTAIRTCSKSLDAGKYLSVLVFSCKTSVCRKMLRSGTSFKRAAGFMWLFNGGWGQVGLIIFWIIGLTERFLETGFHYPAGGVFWKGIRKTGFGKAKRRFPG